jgi:hypothetical protein
MMKLLTHYLVKHEPEAAQENKPVQYTADTIAVLKIEMVQWYP